jgi:hypothetical protein
MKYPPKTKCTNSRLKVSRSETLVFGFCGHSPFNTNPDDMSTATSITTFVIYGTPRFVESELPAERWLRPQRVGFNVVSVLIVPTQVFGAHGALGLVDLVVAFAGWLDTGNGTDGYFL